MLVLGAWVVVRQLSPGKAQAWAWVDYEPVLGQASLWHLEVGDPHADIGAACHSHSTGACLLNEASVGLSDNRHYSHRLGAACSLVL